MEKKSEMHKVYIRRRNLEEMEPTSPLVSLLETREFEILTFHPITVETLEIKTSPKNAEREMQQP